MRYIDAEDSLVLGDDPMAALAAYHASVLGDDLPEGLRDDAELAYRLSEGSA